MRRPSRDRTVAGVIAVAAIMTGLAGCGSSSSGTSAGVSPFNDQSGHPLTCMAHQTASPVAIDRPGPSEDPESVLAYLSYYTANGNKPYCDGKPATAIDRKWLALYVAGGSSRAKIQKALSN